MERKQAGMADSASSSSDRRSVGPSGQPLRFARACTRCRQQKLACKPGITGNNYPCARCEDTASECVLVEKQRATPIPTLSSKLSRQEASLSDLAGQLHDIQSRLSRLADVPARLALLENRYLNRQNNGSTNPSGGATGMAPPSNVGHTPSPIHTTGSMRDATELTPREEEGTDIVHDFENTDMNTTSLMSDVRVYRPSNDRAAKRKRVEDEPDTCAMAVSIFITRCLPAVNFMSLSEAECTSEAISEKSALLFWAIVAVGSRETPELFELFLEAQDNTMELLRQTLGGPKPSFWDMCGAMVWNKWLAPVRPIGHVVDMAYELDLHRRYEFIRDKLNPTPDDVRSIRLWVSVTVQDYFLSVSTGRPPHYPHRTRVFEQARWLVSLPGVRTNDYRILATYEYEEIAHSIQDELSRTGVLSEDWENQVNSRISAIDDWYARWEPIGLSKSEPGELCSMIKSIRINHHLAKLSVYSVVLRGVRTTEDLSPKRLRYVGLSVEAARANCQLCASDFQGPAIQYLGESQMYAFLSAAVFLLKVLWLLPDAYDSTTIFHEVEAVIENLKAVSGQRSAIFLAQILKHVKEHHAQSVMRLPPTLMPASSEYAHPPPIAVNGEANTHNPFEMADGFNSSSNGGALAGLEMFNEPESDFWSWLASDGQNFSPLVNTLDTFDSSLARGGL